LPQELLDANGEQGRAGYAIINTIDMVYPIFYGGLIYLYCLTGTPLIRKRFPVLLNIAAAFTLFVVATDYAENMFVFFSFLAIFEFVLLCAQQHGAGTFIYFDQL